MVFYCQNYKKKNSKIILKSSSLSVIKLNQNFLHDVNTKTETNIINILLALFIKVSSKNTLFNAAKYV